MRILNRRNKIRYNNDPPIISSYPTDGHDVILGKDGNKVIYQKSISFEMTPTAQSANASKVVELDCDNILTIDAVFVTHGVLNNVVYNDVVKNGYFSNLWYGGLFCEKTDLNRLYLTVGDFRALDPSANERSAKANVIITYFKEV